MLGSCPGQAGQFIHRMVHLDLAVEGWPLELPSTAGVDTCIIDDQMVAEPDKRFGDPIRGHRGRDLMGRRSAPAGRGSECCI